MSGNPKTNGDRLSFIPEPIAAETYEMIPHNSKSKESSSKYDQLFPEIEEVLGPSPTFRPCTLVWRDLTVHTKLKDGKLKRLVNNVSGIAKPGTMTALMGPR
ncbi:hypothetical protein HF086_013338 [Spodoptera exigua]|uniref:Uncharacterized protein n=1 Tax=Spodoptera exigua TaxID=7107 RepID=A0A922M418_SPOEX|nr:hypothetical protein HF086_013338 [Spodoptera exigua]